MFIFGCLKFYMILCSIKINKRITCIVNPIKFQAFMENEKKCNIILTTKGGMEFGVTCNCTPDELQAASSHWQGVLNAKYGGTDWEIISYRLASDEEIKNFRPSPEELHAPSNWPVK